MDEQDSKRWFTKKRVLLVLLLLGLVAAPVGYFTFLHERRYTVEDIPELVEELEAVFEVMFSDREPPALVMKYGVVRTHRRARSSITRVVVHRYRNASWVFT